MVKKLFQPQACLRRLIKALLCRNLFWLVCLASVIGLATVRSHPVYGKIDFYLLDGRPWWPSWKPLVTYTRTNDNTPVYTDYATAYILGGVFGEVPLLDVIGNRPTTLYIEDMEKNKLPEQQVLNIYLTQEDLSKDFKCIINLIGYKSSWVPEETGYWNKTIGNTRKFYNFRTHASKSDIGLALKNFPLHKCAVFAQENENN